MACDMCDKKGTDLNRVLTKYETDDIKSICDECNALVNSKMWKIRSVTDGIMVVTLKRFMSNFKVGNSEFSITDGKKRCPVAIHGDTTECVECGSTWDTNDQYPPKCKGNRK